MTGIQLNPNQPATPHSSCDVVMMEKTTFEYLIEDAYSRGDTDFLRDVLLRKVGELKMYGWRYDGYVGCISSLPGYFNHNINVLRSEVRRDLFNPEHPIYTKVKDEVPARYKGDSRACNCLVADGCMIEGEVENCVLFRGVHIGKGTCVVLQACDIQEDCELSYVILDKGCTVRQGRRLAGYDSFPIIIRKGSTV